MGGSSLRHRPHGPTNDFRPAPRDLQDSINSSPSPQGIQMGPTCIRWLSLRLLAPTIQDGDPRGHGVAAGQEAAAAGALHGVAEASRGAEGAADPLTRSIARPLVWDAARVRDAARGGWRATFRGRRRYANSRRRRRRRRRSRVPPMLRREQVGEHRVGATRITCASHAPTGAPVVRRAFGPMPSSRPLRS